MTKILRHCQIFVKIMSASYAFLNPFTVVDLCKVDGKLFQSFAARIEKKFLLKSVFA